MDNVLLTNIENIKQTTNISDNVNGKVLQTAIVEAQEIDLQEIIGTKLLNKLKQLVRAGEVSLPGNEVYKELMDIIQIYLAYNTVTKALIPLTYKIDNIGVVQTTDENIATLQIDDVYNINEYYKKRADYYGSRIQNYVLKHRGELEICDNDCYQISAHLNSAANTGLWLGGALGYGYEKDYHRFYDK
jgi:hypothetical protein